MEIFDRHYFFVNKTLLRSTGLWPYDSRWRKLCIRSLIHLVFGVCVIFPQLVRIYHYFRVDIDLLLEHAAILLFLMSMYLKFLTSVFYEEKLRVIYDNMVNNWQSIRHEDEIKILTQYSENGSFLTICYMMYLGAATGAYCFLPLVPLILDVFIPLNGTIRPRFYILGGEYFVLDKAEDYGKVYVFDVVAVILSSWVICAVDSMYAASIEHCLGLFAIVKLRLQSIAKPSSDHWTDVPYKLIVQLIKLHADILNFTDILESSYSSSFLVLIGINIVFLCFECAIVLTRFGQAMELTRYSMVMVGIVVHLFYISWPGQKLTDYSLGIYEDTYLNEWYTCSTKAQKLLCFMTMRCSKPCRLSAGGIYDMNFRNFAKIVKTSISYLTVLISFR